MDAARQLWRGERIVRNARAALGRSADVALQRLRGCRQPACVQFGTVFPRTVRAAPNVVVRRASTGKTAS